MSRITKILSGTFSGRAATIFITTLVITSTPLTTLAAVLNAGDAFSVDERNTINRQIIGSPNSLSGSLSYEYPMVVPPGRGSLTPDIKLQYSSQSRDVDSAFGVGWDINIPSIERINRTGAEKMYGTNIFYSSFDGEIGSTSAATTSTTLGAKFESGAFNKYVFTNNSWRMTDKQGTVYTFGAATTTRMDNPATTTMIYKWMLEEVRDTNNNYIKYQYTKDRGQIYPSHILYTGATSTDGPFDIAFTLENRTDVSTSSRAQFSVVTNKRVSEIQAKVNGVMVRKYVLAYTTADNARTSILQSVTESGQDESANVITLPATTFSYQKAIGTFAASSTWTSPVSFVQANRDVGSRVVDVNGDGLQDIVVSADYGSGNTASSTYINTSSGWSVDAAWKAPIYFANWSGVVTHELGVRFADVNGDGRVDILQGISQTGSSATTTYINTGAGWTASTTWNTPIYFKDGTTGDDDNGVRIVDLNGDGLPDLLKSRTTAGVGSNSVYINNGAGWALDSAWNMTFAEIIKDNTDAGVRFMEVNGDGLPDVVKLTQTSGVPDQHVYLNNGHGWTTAGEYTFPVAYFNIGNVDAGTRPEDINGDGLDDLVYADGTGAGSRTVYINNGHGWTANAIWNLPEYNVTTGGTTDLGVRYVDVNADGTPDVVRAYYDGVSSPVRTTYLSDSSPADRLIFVHTTKGGNLGFAYKGSNQYQEVSGNKVSNKYLPLSYSTLAEKKVFDGINATSTTRYTYGDGRYYFSGPYDRRFVGFATTSVTDAVGNVTKQYFHQGNGTESTLGEYSDSIAKFNKMYREETYDASGNLFAETINKWDALDLGLGRGYAKLIQKIQATFDGNASHKDTAESYSYDAYGNVQQIIGWGEVTASENGTFTDIGTDKASTTVSYAASTTPYIVGLPSQKTTVNQSLVKIGESRYYYDGLALGAVNKGNNTKVEKWITGASYVNTQKAFNAYGLVTQDTDERGKQTNYVYDSFMLYVATSTNPLAQATNAYYDYSLGKPKQVTDANGLTSQTVYDALDRTSTEKQPDLTTPATLVTRATYTYVDTTLPTSIQETSNLSAATSSNGYTYFDGLGRVIQKRQQAESAGVFSVSDKIYDAIGQVFKESLPYFSSGSAYTATTSNTNLYTTNLYDALKRVTQSGTVVGTTTNSYDNWIATTTDANGNTKAFAKDAFGNLVKVDEKNGTSTYSTVYTYDRANNLTKITDANANVRNFTYDGVGHELSAEDLHVSGDANFGTWTYTYDNAGNQVTRTDAKNQLVTFGYDDINRVITENYSGTAGVEVGYLYDTCTYGKGRLCQATSSSATTTYTYNSIGKVDTETKRVAGNNYLTQYGVDQLGNVVTLTYPNGTTVKYNYNAAGLVDTIVQKSATSSAYSYLVDALDYGPTRQLVYQLNHNSTASYFTYDPNELYRLVNKTTVGPKTGGMGLMMFEPPVEESLAADTATAQKTAFLSPEEYLKEGLATTTDSGDVALATPIPLADKRTESSDTSLVGFTKAGDPTYHTRLYPAPVYYENPDTKTLEPIDTTLIDSDLAWTVSKAPYHASAKKTFGDDFITFINGLQELSVTALRAGKGADGFVPKEGPGAGKEIVYLNALGDGIDMDVHMDETSLRKEAVINTIDSLGDIASSTVFELPFKIASNHAIDVLVDGMRLSEQKSIVSANQAEIVDDQGVVTYVRAPIASYHKLDSPDQFINIPIRYELTDGGILMTKLLPVEWLKDAQFPVRTDATFSTYVGLGDGHVAYQGDASVPPWSTVHDNDGTSSHVAFNYNIPEVALEVDSASGANSFQIFRVYFPFDTSTLPDAAIVSAANLHLYINSVHIAGSLDMYVASSSQAATSTLAKSDYPLVSNVALSSSYAGTGLTTSAYNTFALNAQGLIAISTTGWTKLALREKNDLDNVAPTGQIASVWAGIAASGAAGTSTDPYLDITYTVAGSHEPTTPTVLQTESLNNPSNVSDQTPEFSAIFNDPDGSDYIGWYQIQVSAASTSFATLLWDSGMATATASTTQGNRSVDVSYGGTPFTLDGSKYFWRIKFWDNAGNPSPWSDSATATPWFTMAVNNANYANCFTAQTSLSNPTGLQCGAPMFSSIYFDGNQSTSLVADKYRLQVSTSSTFASLFWDSGASGSTTGAIVDGARSWDYAYRGPSLSFASTTYYWREAFITGGTQGAWSTGTTTFGTANVNVLQNLSYTYDKAGNITKIVDGSDTQTAKTQYLTYDGLNRLTQAIGTTTANGANYTQTYAYNPLGNITYKSDVGSYSYTGNTGSSYANPHAPTSINAATYAYDFNGNLASTSAGITNTWDYNNRLTKSVKNFATTTYAYDHTGARVSYANGSLTTIYPNKYYNATATTSTSNIYLGDSLITTIQSGGTTSGGGSTSTSTPAYVQSKKDSATGVATFTSSVTTGNLVVVALSIWNTTVPTNAISDNKGNTYTKAVEAINAGTTDHVALFYAQNVSGGSSFTVTSSIGGTIAIQEYSGVALTGALDKTGSNTGTSVTPASSAITASVGQELYVGAAWSEGDGNTWMAGNGYTLRETETNNNTAERIATEDAVITLASTTFSRFTTSASNPWAAVIATFKPLVTVGGGGTTTNATTTNYIHADHLGSTAVVTDGTGAAQQTTDYYPYGAIRFDTSTNGSNQTKKYIAQTYDNETALNYLNARYMSGMNGQFTSEDPTFLSIGDSKKIFDLTGLDQRHLLMDPQMLNSYGYGKGNPVTYKDANGKVAFIPVVLGVVAVYGWAMNAVNAYSAYNADIAYRQTMDTRDRTEANLQFGYDRVEGVVASTFTRAGWQEVSPALGVLQAGYDVVTTAPDVVNYYKGGAFKKDARELYDFAQSNAKRGTDTINNTSTNISTFLVQANAANAYNKGMGAGANESRLWVTPSGAVVNWNGQVISGQVISNPPASKK